MSKGLVRGPCNSNCHNEDRTSDLLQRSFAMIRLIRRATLADRMWGWMSLKQKFHQSAKQRDSQVVDENVRRPDVNGWYPDLIESSELIGIPLEIVIHPPLPHRVTQNQWDQDINEHTHRYQSVWPQWVGQRVRVDLPDLEYVYTRLHVRVYSCL